MTENEKDLADLRFLLDESESRQLTKDEVETVFKLTRKRIQGLEKKAVNRLKALKQPKENNPSP